MRQNVFVTHKFKKCKTRTALYEIEYQLECIFRKINFEKLGISSDQWMMFCKSSFDIVLGSSIDLYMEGYVICMYNCVRNKVLQRSSFPVLWMLMMFFVMFFILAAARFWNLQTKPSLSSFDPLCPVSCRNPICLNVTCPGKRVAARHLVYVVSCLLYDLSV